ncbi:cytochrome P450 4C1-like [Anthonomus grandis grandis]|uniref:cytochrome P450 4C1-like n=1 Tax=Anthonomus grandis grandis TaxID=2921223 RepID=UPI0021650F1E|nr:cytochrome P450 4C1-like [Anthonomus grandis grandis]
MHNASDGMLTLSTIVWGGSLLVVAFIVKSLFEKRRIFQFARNHGGYRFYPVIGNGYHIIGKNIFHAIQGIIDKFGLPCNMWLGHDYHYITADAAEIKIILNHPNTFDKATIYGNLELAFNQSLLLAPVDLWKKNRKYHARSFSQPVLNTFVQFFYKKSQILVDTVLRDAHKRDTFEIFETYTFDSFCESIIGFDYDLQVNPKCNLVECVGEIQALGGKRLITYFYYPMILWVLSSEGRRVVKCIRQAIKFVLQAIKDKRKIFADSPVICSSALPLLDSMLAAGDKFTDKQISQEMFLFTTAATDTSGYTLAYFFTMLGMHPDVQRKVYEEVISVVGKERPIYFEDLPNLKYTERAIFEAMRILPVVPFLGRRATADTDLGGKIIPKGSNIIISTFDLHRSEKYWPDPLKYDPDRFLPEKVAQRDPYTFIPFSGGPRNCIGKTYSIMLMKTCAANVVRNYEMSSPYKSVRDLQLKSCITMRTMHPLECHFRPRNCD